MSKEKTGPEEKNLARKDPRLSVAAVEKFTKDGRMVFDHHQQDLALHIAVTNPVEILIGGGEDERDYTTCDHKVMCFSPGTWSERPALGIMMKMDTTMRLKSCTTRVVWARTAEGLTRILGGGNLALDLTNESDEGGGMVSGGPEDANLRAGGAGWKVAVLIVRMEIVGCFVTLAHLGMASTFYITKLGRPLAATHGVGIRQIVSGQNLPTNLFLWASQTMDGEGFRMLGENSNIGLNLEEKRKKPSVKEWRDDVTVLSALRSAEKFWQIRFGFKPEEYKARVEDISPQVGDEWILPKLFEHHWNDGLVRRQVQSALEEDTVGTQLIASFVFLTFAVEDQLKHASWTLVENIPKEAMPRLRDYIVANAILQTESLHERSLHAMRLVLTTNGNYVQKFDYTPPSDEAMRRRLDKFPLNEIEYDGKSEEITSNGKVWKPGQRAKKGLKTLTEMVEKIEDEREDCKKLSEIVKKEREDRIEFLEHQNKAERRCHQEVPILDNLFINGLTKQIVEFKSKQKHLSNQMLRNISSIPAEDLKNPADITEEDKEERERHKDILKKGLESKFKNKKHYHTGIPIGDRWREGQRAGTWAWCKGYDSWLLYRTFERLYPDYHCPSRLYVWLAQHLVDNPGSRTLAQACPPEATAQLFEMKEGLRRIFPCSYFEEDRYKLAYREELDNDESSAMRALEAKVVMAAGDVADSKIYYEQMLARQINYVDLLSYQLGYVAMKRAAITAEVIRYMKELQSCVAHMEKMRGRLEKETMRMLTCVDSYKGLLGKHNMIPCDGKQFDLPGVKLEDRFYPGEETRMMSIKIKEKIDRANVLCQRQIKEALSEDMEKSCYVDYDLHEMANCLMREQNGEAEKVYWKVMSKFVLKGEDVRFTELANEVEKVKPKESRNLGARPKVPKSSGCRKKSSGGN